MRKIILFMHLSLDGMIAGSNGELGWANMADQSIGQHLIPELLSTVDTMVLGHNLYKGFEQSWSVVAKDPNSPQDLVEFANWIINSPKIVFSHSSQDLNWNNSRLITVKNDDEIIEEVSKLKQSQGCDIVLFGGVHMAQTFVKLNLIDEYRFKLESVIVGKGSSLFSDVQDRMKLQLFNSKVFESGVVALYYRPSV
jgi:dihydrofolate reductase